MQLRQYTEKQIKKAMIDAGVPTYAALGRKLGRTKQAVRKLILRQEDIPSKSLERDIYDLLAEHLNGERSE